MIEAFSTIQSIIAGSSTPSRLLGWRGFLGSNKSSSTDLFSKTGIASSGLRVRDRTRTEGLFFLGAIEDFFATDGNKCSLRFDLQAPKTCFSTDVTRLRR
jgi:hypothetical protein